MLTDAEFKAFTLWQQAHRLDASAYVGLSPYEQDRLDYERYQQEQRHGQLQEQEQEQEQPSPPPTQALDTNQRAWNIHKAVELLQNQRAADTTNCNAPVDAVAFIRSQLSAN